MNTYKIIFRNSPYGDTTTGVKVRAESPARAVMQVCNAYDTYGIVRVDVVHDTVTELKPELLSCSGLRMWRLPNGNVACKYGYDYFEYENVDVALQDSLHNRFLRVSRRLRDLCTV